MDAEPPVLAADHPIWTSPELAQAVRGERAGDVIRLVRRAAQLTLADLGARTGYSASTVSRLERGHPSLRDITVLRRMAACLSIPAC